MEVCIGQTGNFTSRPPLSLSLSHSLSLYKRKYKLSVCKYVASSCVDSWFIDWLTRDISVTQQYVSLCVCVCVCVSVCVSEQCICHAEQQVYPSGSSSKNRPRNRLAIEKRTTNS